MVQIALRMLFSIHFMCVFFFSALCKDTRCAISLHFHKWIEFTHVSMKKHSFWKFGKFNLHELVCVNCCAWFFGEIPKFSTCNSSNFSSMSQYRIVLIYLMNNCIQTVHWILDEREMAKKWNAETNESQKEKETQNVRPSETMVLTL